MQPKFGIFETYPTRFTRYEAWVLIDGIWRSFNAAEVINTARVVTEAEFSKAFGQVVALPTAAFQTGE